MIIQVIFRIYLKKWFSKQFNFCAVKFEIYPLVMRLKITSSRIGDVLKISLLRKIEDTWLIFHENWFWLVVLNVLQDQSKIFLAKIFWKVCPDSSFVIRLNLKTIFGSRTRLSIHNWYVGIILVAKQDVIFQKFENSNNSGIESESYHGIKGKYPY